MKKIRCMIVEDEPVSQEILMRYIQDYQSLELVAICSNAIEASQKIASIDPELLFLDIAMPRLSGLDFYKSLTNPPYVIFTTAYPEYAVNGFEVNAIDYLVKPFSFERFIKAMGKLQTMMNATVTRNSRFIRLQADKKIHNVDIDQILFLEAMGDYVKVVMQDKTLIVHQTLQKIIDQLPTDLFYRVHKSYAVSLNKLEYVEGNQIIIKASRVPIGQTYRNEFIEVLQKK